ncbi:hypothetical protein [Desulfomicrobium escambiense]|uniref:hypothetical protein n=1 Tax=Desulfomicrobium escambiense TaxID=29503 RepID=UPI000415EA72|nr:hypothetical protein [Desulfomicrobium escambiense]
MIGFQKIASLLTAILLLAQPLMALPLSAPRLVPEGSVKLVKTGAVVESEMPAPTGTLMACNGQCFIEADGVQLLGADKTVFAVHEDHDAFTVLVDTGSVSFAMRADAKPVEFKTPFDTFLAKPALVPVSSEAVIRGTLEVSESRAVLTMAEGSLELTNDQGQKLLKAGNSIVLAKGIGLSEADTEALAAAGVATATLAIIGASIVAVAGSGDGGGGDSDEASPHQ